MSYPPVTPRYRQLEQTLVTLAGAASVAAAIGFAGGYDKVHITPTVACFVAFGPTASNGVSATGYPLAANQEYVFEGPISALAFNSAVAGSVAIVGVG